MYCDLKKKKKIKNFDSTSIAIRYCYVLRFLFLTLDHGKKLNDTLNIQTVTIKIKKHILAVGLGDMAKNIITIIFLISVDIDNYHDKCQIFISFKFKARILLQSESCRNQTINFP